MQRIMLRRAIHSALLAGLTIGLASCGGGGDSSSMNQNSTTPSQTMTTMPLTISDASSDDWACIGVRVLSIALVPQGGGANVTVWTAASPAPYVNLELLDQLGEILGNVSVPAGTYSGAVLTLGANPGDVMLTVAANPEAGFPVAGGTPIPSSNIQIQNASGASGSLTVSTTVNFDAPLSVTTSGSNALDLEFNLAHPAFIVGHTPPAAQGQTLWAVNFKGPVIRRHPIRDIANLVLRHTYGTVGAVSSASFSMMKDYAVYPATNPETAIESSQSLTINADSTYGTIVYDLDAGSRTVVENFSNETSLSGKYVRVAARYQEDGSLTAVRVWASSEFQKVWESPEGHVLNVNETAGTMTVTDESGIPVQVSVNSATEFFFRNPGNPKADAASIGSGTAFLANLVRGFKVHVSSDPLGNSPLTAATVDIETAAFGGHISNAGSMGFTYTSDYLAANDNYSVSLNYIASTTANGNDDDDNQIDGFKWWDFTFPTTVDFGASAIGDFVAATEGAVSFGGSVGNLVPFGASLAMWGDGDTNLSGWYFRDAVLVPTPIPLGTVSTAFDTSSNSFAMTVVNGTLPVTVNVSATQGSATLVYEVDRSNGIVTVTPVDITTSSGYDAMSAALAAGALVKVYGVPLAPVAPATTGSLKAYVMIYYAGMMPSM
jgi:hypothetical protein